MPNHDDNWYDGVVMESEAKPLSGENHRSSFNYDFSVVKNGALLWKLPVGVTIRIKSDVSMGTDKILIDKIKNGDISDFPENTRLYIADPSGAKEKFKIYVESVKK